MKPKHLAFISFKKTVKLELAGRDSSEIRSIAMERWKGMSDEQKNEYYECEYGKSTFLNEDRNILFCSHITSDDYDWLKCQLIGRGDIFQIPIYNEEQWIVAARNIRLHIEISSLSDDDLLKEYILNKNKLRLKILLKLNRCVDKRKRYIFLKFCVENKLLIDSNCSLRLMKRYIEKKYEIDGLFDTFICDILTHGMEYTLSNTNHHKKCLSYFQETYYRLGPSSSFKDFMTMFHILTPEERDSYFT